jgi:hypothetical protein
MEAMLNLDLLPLEPARMRGIQATVAVNQSTGR